MALNPLAEGGWAPLLAGKRARLLPFPRRHAAADKANRFYRPELDMLRFVAFCMVWTAHALIPFEGRLPGTLLHTAEGMGSCGVPLFFLLSGYLITELLRRERAATGTVRLGAFYLRRILRIWPLYFTVLGSYALLGLRFHGFGIEPGRLLASSLLAGNWYIALHPSITTPLRATWSISVEEQWYLLAPLFERRLSRRALAGGCAVVACVSVLVLIGLAKYADPAWLHVTAWVNSVVQFLYLAAGVGIALVLRGRIPGLPLTPRILLAVSGVAALAGASGVCSIRAAGATHGAGGLVVGYLLAGLGDASLFFACIGMTWAPRVFVRLGQLSFGLYMLHETAFFLTDAAARQAGVHAGLVQLGATRLSALGLTMLFAWLSYRFLERPFLRLKARWAVVRTREVA